MTVSSAISRPSAAPKRMINPDIRGVYRWRYTLAPMHSSLKIGNTADVSVNVTEDMCPAFDGIVVHRVYSTWSMAHHMELAARKVLAPHLEEHEEGIGSHLSIDHVAPAPLGHTVRVEARAIELGPTTLVCECIAYDGDRIIGKG